MRVLCCGLLAVLTGYLAGCGTVGPMGPMGPGVPASTYTSGIRPAPRPTVATRPMVASRAKPSALTRDVQRLRRQIHRVKIKLRRQRNRR